MNIIQDSQMQKYRNKWSQVFEEWKKEYDKEKEDFNDLVAYNYRDWYPSVNEPTRPAHDFIPYADWLEEKLNKEIELAKARDHYYDVMVLSEKLSDLLHEYRKDQQARWVEDGAFLFEQEYICRNADIPLKCFDGRIPCLEHLKTALTEEANFALENRDFADFFAYKTMNSRICRVQGKERDAHLLDCSAAKYKVNFEKKIREAFISKGKFERKCLRRVAGKYGDKLFKKE